MITKKRLAALLFGAALFIGCGGDDGESTLPSDAESASFGGSNTKADGRFSECDLQEVLKFVNESTTTVESLKEVGINRLAGENLIKHRNGDDGVFGTGDDNIFDDLEELDSVYWVGPVTLEQIVNVVDSRCVINLDKRPYIDATTFGSVSGGGWSRDNVELEAAMTVSGVTGAKLHEILTSKDSKDRTIFSRLRKSDKMAGFTYDYDLSEVPWDKDAMEAREAMPFIALSIESGRFEMDESGMRELSLGTDIMDDTYYDTPDYALMGNGMVVRGRVRWDSDTVVRRLLIAAKFNSAVSEEGLKQAAKIDVRTEGGDDMATLDRDVMRGETEWSGRRTTLKPIEEVYSRLDEAGALPDIQGREKVLLLNPLVHIRSYRSRYHLNEASMGAIQKVHRNGFDRIESVLAYVNAGLDAGTLEASPELTALIEFGTKIVDGSAVAETAKAQLEALGAPTDVVMPDEFTTPATQLDLDKQQVISEVVDSLMHQFSDQLDDLDRDVSQSKGLDGDEYVDQFVAWQKLSNSAYKSLTTYETFLEKYTEISEADKAGAIAAFNLVGVQYRDADNGDFEDFVEIDEANWDALGKHLSFEYLKVSQRMINWAGTTSNALWFDMAREYYVPDSNRSNYSNFMIDTIDYTEMVTQNEWMNIPEDKRNPVNIIDPAKIFHTNLVNEVQIELGKEEPFLERIAELKADIETNGETAENKRLMEGTHFVFDHYRAALTTIADLKGDDIVDRLEDEGAKGDLEWGPSEMSKGKTALSIISDQD